MSATAGDDICPGVCWSAWGLVHNGRNVVTLVNITLVARNQLGGKYLPRGNWQI